MVVQNTVMAVLSQALKLEQEGREFYLKAAEETLNAKGRAMFLSLADDEKLHAEIVLKQLHAVEGGGAYVLMPDLRVPAIDLDAKLFPPDPAQLEKKLGPDPNELDALHLALEVEIKSYDLYRAAAKQTQDPAGKAMYQWLTNAELTHFNLLMSNYGAIVAKGAWI